MFIKWRLIFGDTVLSQRYKYQKTFCNTWFFGKYTKFSHKLSKKIDKSSKNVWTFWASSREFLKKIKKFILKPPRWIFKYFKFFPRFRVRRQILGRKVSSSFVASVTHCGKKSEVRRTKTLARYITPLQYAISRWNSKIKVKYKGRRSSRGFQHF